MARRGHDASLDYHRRMVEDVHRMDAYERALRARVRPGDVVLDLGCGTGILGLLALRAGAARVHAVEAMPIARLARQLADANGLGARFHVHEADVVELAPVEPVDLVVGDFMGRFVIDDDMLDAVAAAGRWLRPGGGFLPSRLELLLAPAGDFHMPTLAWVEAVVHGIDLRPLLPHVHHDSYAAAFRNDVLLAAPRSFVVIEPPMVPDLAGQLAFIVERPGLLRGLLGWFDAELAPGITLSTAPGIETHWGQVLLPLPERAVEPGDALEVCVRVVEEEAWEYEWTATLRRGDAVLLDVALDSRYQPERPLPPSPPAVRGPAAPHDEATAAFHAGRLADAVRGWEEAVRALPGRDPALAPPLYENLGIAYLQSGQPVAAAHAFLRALDGDPRSREQSLRLLVAALDGMGQHADAARLRREHEQAFGPG